MNKLQLLILALRKAGLGKNTIASNLLVNEKQITEVDREYQKNKLKKTGLTNDQLN